MYSLSLSTLENLLRLISKKNKGIYIDPAKVEVKDVREFRTVGSNTAATLIGKKGSNLPGESEIKYPRKDIRTLIHEPLKIVPGNQRNTSELLPVLNRQYGLKLVDSDIIVEPCDVTKPLTELTVKLSPTNLVWIGSIPVLITEPANSLASIITVTDLSLDDDDIDDGKLIADILYFAINFTVLAGSLSTYATGSAVDKALCKSINTALPQRWVHYVTPRQYNVSDATVSYNGSTENCPFNCNDDFTNVMFITLGDLCTNYKGSLVLHYN